MDTRPPDGESPSLKAPGDRALLTLPLEGGRAPEIAGSFPGCVWLHEKDKRLKQHVFVHKKITLCLYLLTV